MSTKDQECVLRAISIDEVKQLTHEHQGDGAILLVFDLQGSVFIGTSYGNTRERCATLKDVLDRISDMLIAGELKVI